jgi:hypothetical protein
MNTQVPSVLPTLLIGDDAFLLAELSCTLAKRGAYLPILEAPRVERPDLQGEILRCYNAAARLRPKAILLVDLPQDTVATFSGMFPRSSTHQINSMGQISSIPLTDRRKAKGYLHWGRSRIGLGLLRALREGRQIVFDDNADYSDAPIVSESGHLVVYEEDNQLAEVIAANYAFALGAGLVVIPGVPEEQTNRILELFYSVYEARDRSVTDSLRTLQALLKELTYGLNLEACRCVTFVTKDLPWGFAFPECPATHLFSYPDLGRSLLNGVMAGQTDAPGIRIALLIDPSESQAKDVTYAIDALRVRGVFVHGLGSMGATVYRVSRMIRLFPFDFLLISTHCGDAPGGRWTYNFTDRDGRDRVLVVDVAHSFTAVPEEDKIEVMQFTRFVSLDGVDWNDPKKDTKLDVGSAIQDYLARSQAPEKLMPVKKETISRVVGSAALKLANGNYLPTPTPLADDGTPIVLNNACVSWHRLARDFTFGNARAYIGTLFPVTELEAQEIADRLLKRHFGKPLAVALWHSQNEVFAESVRRPYVLIGPHFQSLRTTRVQAPTFILSRLKKSLHIWMKKTDKGNKLTESQRRTIKDYQRFLHAEIERIRTRWFS